jgi:hypothetical protein
MIRKSFFILILISVLATLACVDIDIKTKINPDGSGIQNWTITTSALLANKIRTQIKQEPLFKGLKLEFTEEYKEGDFILKTRIPFQNVGQLKNQYFEVRLQKNGFFQTKYDYTEVWKASTGAKLLQDTENAFRPKSVKVSVEACGTILNSNAENVEGQIAHWTIPIGGLTQDRVLRIQWQRWNMDRIIGISLAALLLVLVLFWILKKSQKVEPTGVAPSANSKACSNCNALLSEDSAFCNKCGTKV